MKHNERQTDRKSTLPRKLVANRRNAQRSAGPKTERGKNNSRRNALKHGDRKIWGKVSVTPALANNAVPTSDIRPGRLQ